MVAMGLSIKDEGFREPPTAAAVVTFCSPKFNGNGGFQDVESFTNRCSLGDSCNFCRRYQPTITRDFT